ncbi:hypothetical protein ACGFSB_03630 [Streptomyces sp. NPDC048441]|uniref:hypothetical protein n=1 Tax=Streptomyces sp. NPDC048441 TaxID=3365552 RepID=UPI00371E8C92
MSVRRVRVYLLAAAGSAVVISLLLAYFLGAFDSKSSDHFESSDVCKNLRNKQAAADIFNSLFPQSNKYSVIQASKGATVEYYGADCEVRGDDGESFLRLNAFLTATEPKKSNGKEWDGDVFKPLSRGEIRHFDAGIKGTSASNLAGISVPCYGSGKFDKLPYHLAVYAHAPQSLRGSDKGKRQKLIDLALDFAHTTHKQAKCEVPSRLPDRVTVPDG